MNDLEQSAADIRQFGLKMSALAESKKRARAALDAEIVVLDNVVFELNALYERIEGRARKQE